MLVESWYLGFFLTQMANRWFLCATWTANALHVPPVEPEHKFYFKCFRTLRPCSSACASGCLYESACVSVCMSICTSYMSRFIGICRNVEEMLKAKGEEVQRLINSEDGTVEVTWYHWYDLVHTSLILCSEHRLGLFKHRMIYNSSLPLLQSSELFV